MKSRSDLPLESFSAEVQRSERTDAAFRQSEQRFPSPTQAKASLRSSEQNAAVLRDAEQRVDAASALAAELLDEAFTNAGLETKEIAHLCLVSGSLVEKWRKSDQRGCPNLIQMLLLPPRFHIELNRAMNRRFGFGRAALARIVESLGDLAVAIGE